MKVSECERGQEYFLTTFGGNHYHLKCIGSYEGINKFEVLETGSTEEVGMRPCKPFSFFIDQIDDDEIKFLVYFDSMGNVR